MYCYTANAEHGTANILHLKNTKCK